VWLGTTPYKFKLTTAADVDIWTVDNVGGFTTATQLAASGGSSLVGFLQGGTGAVARTVQSKNRDAISVKDFGAVGDNTTDDTGAIQAAIDYAVTLGGQTVNCGGLTYRTTGPIIVKDDVTLDLQGGKIRAVLSVDIDYGARVRNRAVICNGEIEVQSSGSPGSQVGYHAPIMVGPFYGDGGTVATPSVDEGVTGWRIQNLKLSTNAVGKVCVQIVGGANNGIVENIEAPDSSAIGGVVHLDWGTVGTISSSDITASRANFDAGTAYTTHPNTITIRNIKAGALSRAKSGVDTGSHVVRLSGAYNIIIENVRAAQCTYAGLRVTVGDLGFEFAQTAVKPFRAKNISARGLAFQNTTDSWAVYCDSYADNIAAAVSGGYSPLIDPLHETNIEVSQVVAKGSGGASVTPGLYVIQSNGGRFVDMDMTGYSHGCLVDELVRGVQIHGRFWANRGHGIYIHHGTNKPEDVEVLTGTHCFQNGQDAGFAGPCGIAIESSVRCRVNGALLGHRTAASETTQLYGVRVVSTNAVDVEIENCHVLSVESGGIAYVILSNNDYGYVKLFRNNTAASAITTKYNGVNIIPINRFLAADGSEIAHYTASRVSLSADTTPTAGTWVTGDLIFHSNPTGGNTGTRCTVAGTPGTWGLF
jgi:hypothetical protein